MLNTSSQSSFKDTFKEVSSIVVNKMLKTQREKKVLFVLIINKTWLQTVVFYVERWKIST